MTKEPQRFSVVKGDPPKNRSGRVEPVVCLWCRHKRGAIRSDVLELRTGGFWKKGRMVGFEKTLVCAYCYIHDNRMEVLGTLR